MIDRHHVLGAAILLQPLLWLGFGRRFPWAQVGLERIGMWTWAIVSVAFLAYAIAPAFQRGGSGLDRPAWPTRLLAPLILAVAPLTLVFDFAAARHFARFGYQTPWLMVPVELVVFGALVWWVRRGRPVGQGAWIATAGCVAHRLSVMVHFPITADKSDMLPMIRSAIELAARGDSPYADQATSATNGFMPYLPGTWLAHWPTAALGVDMRWIGTLALLGVGVWIAVRVRSQVAEAFAVLVLLNPYHAFRHDLYFETFLVLTTVLFFLASRDRTAGWSTIVGVGILAGAAVASRQWAWVYAPFIVLALARARRKDITLIRSVTAGAVVAMIAAALITLPWILRGPELFMRALGLHPSQLSTDLTLGLAAPMAALGLRALLIPAQATVCLVLFVSTARRAFAGDIRPVAIASAGWLALLLVVALSQYLDAYFYLSVTFAALGIVLAAFHDEPPIRV